MISGKSSASTALEIFVLYQKRYSLGVISLSMYLNIGQMMEFFGPNLDQETPHNMTAHEFLSFSLM